MPTDSVRVHSDASAAVAAEALNARAFTTGRDIFFAAGQFSSSSAAGRNLIAHELGHVAQQSASEAWLYPHGPRLLQRQEKVTPEKSSSDPQVEVVDFLNDPKEEERKYKWIDYAKASDANRRWFELLRLGDMNPLAPFDPVETPNAFINRVAEWQMAVGRRDRGVSFSEYVFAAADTQKTVTEGSRETVVGGLADVAKSVNAGAFAPGQRVTADGVLGPATLWTMMVAEAVGTNPDSATRLSKVGIPLKMLNFAESDTLAYQTTWRAAHAFLFNQAEYKGTWTTLVQSSTVFNTFEELDLLPELDAAFLTELFFEGELPETPLIDETDLIAILARGYEGEALEVLASTFEVNRTYFSTIDVERLLIQKKPEWVNALSLRMGESTWSRAHKLIQSLDLEPPGTAPVKNTLKKLEKDDGNPPMFEPMAVLAVVAKLPDRDKSFWREVAKKYVASKIALEASAEEATKEYMEGLQKTFQERMEGPPQIEKDDAAAFLELLVGDAFEMAQNALVAGFSQPVPDLELTVKIQRRTAGGEAAKLYDLAKAKDYLIVQLSDDKKGRFPLFARQIEASRAAAFVNGRNPLIFDLIDTPHAAFHFYTPHRFTARKTEKGAESSENPYQLSEEKDALSWERWQGRITRDFASLEPVLVDINQFNPDAGFLVRSARQLGGTDKLYAQFLWTLGGSLPTLSDQLWSGQNKVNIIGWIDAAATVIALGSLFAAPIAAGVEAGGGTAAAELGEAAVNAAIRRALLRAVGKFVINEAIAETLNRISFYINESDDVPAEIKKIWNGAMLLLLIYGGSKIATQGIKQGIKAYKNFRGAKLASGFAALEGGLEAELSAAKGDVSPGEAAAEAEIERNTAKKFEEATAGEGTENGSAGRVRSEDPRAQGVSAAPDAKFRPEDAATLRKILGDDLAGTLESEAGETVRKRLLELKVPEAIRKLTETVPAKSLGRILAAVESAVLASFAKELEKEALERVLKAFAGNADGIRLMRAFVADPKRLSVLLGAVDAERLISLAKNPGAEKFSLVAKAVDPSVLGLALNQMGDGTKGSMARFRSLIDSVGVERTAQVLNTFTPGEIKAPNRWRRNGALTAAQNVTRLAIAYDGVTANRARLGSVPIVSEARSLQFQPSDIGTFFAVGPEAAAPASVKSSVTSLQAATAVAVNRLQELIGLAAKNMITEAELKALPPTARATIEAFLEAGARDSNRAALYGSAVQYLAEAELRRGGGGKLPAGMVFRRSEVRGGRTLIPDVQVELTIQSELRFPKKNKTERVILDWTTKGEAGKIGKYAGGTPPATFAVEIIQPGPPPSPTVTPWTPLVIPGHIGDPQHFDSSPASATVEQNQ